jgi:hypothetical protein
MDNVCNGAFSTRQEAEDALVLRQEPAAELSIVEDGDAEHPFRIWWNRPNGQVL